MQQLASNTPLAKRSNTLPATTTDANLMFPTDMPESPHSYRQPPDVNNVSPMAATRGSIKASASKTRTESPRNVAKFSQSPAVRRAAADSPRFGVVAPGSSSVAASAQAPAAPRSTDKLASVFYSPQRPAAVAPRLGSSSKTTSVAAAAAAATAAAPRRLYASSPVPSPEKRSAPRSRATVDVAPTKTTTTTTTTTMRQAAAAPRAVPGRRVAVHVIPPDGLLATVLKQLASTGDGFPLRLSSAPPVHDEPSPMDQLRRALKQAAVSNSSHSLLLVGRIGSGRAHMLRQALAEMPRDTFHVLTLNCAITDDDESAVRDCISQLASIGTEDISARLQAAARTRSLFGDHLGFLRDYLQSTKERVMLIVDGFDAFAKDTRQKLLYSLLDMAHVGNARLVVVGLAERHDIVSLLEKRVRSRFEGRQIDVPSPPPLDVVVQICKDRLRVSGQDAWNAKVDEVLAAPAVQTVFRNGHLLAKPVTWFLRLCQQAASRLALADRTACFLQPSDFQVALDTLSPDTRAKLARQLSRVEASVMLAMIALERVHRMEAYSFEHVFQAMSPLLTPGGQTHFDGVADRPIERAVALKAYEQLQELGLVLLDRGGRSTFRMGRHVLLDCDRDFLLPMRNAVTGSWSSAQTWWAANLMRMKA